MFFLFAGMEKICTFAKNLNAVLAYNNSSTETDSDSCVLNNREQKNKKLCIGHLNWQQS